MRDILHLHPEVPRLRGLEGLVDLKFGDTALIFVVFTSPNE